MSLGIALVTNLAAILTLAVGVYFSRHHRRDLVLAYVALNVGVLGVTVALSQGGASLGLGLGLFGVLSIIRLRSNAITQEEVAYYFVSLALGLVNGLHPGPPWLAPVVSALLVLTMYVADHPRFAPRTEHQQVVLDRAIADPARLRAELAELLDAEVLRVETSELDLVRDVTVVDVRFRRRTGPDAAVTGAAPGTTLAAVDDAPTMPIPVVGR